ncbi:uncharacterized protein K452DRAFT_283919 [Aplosporella prunicola CBS 121167]|uniref:Vacuolar protein-sorting-associated protein 25 n=1 Tax=Aplosporella prunicola CBS 121167 TaxID=1176127 RepID=A0A6A6BQ47_9PEZI|nr:uncharacterized protein K452DRAFT_283919 [Aplosporella prunicola CBS 121167]KAF2145563.1 hypothetical protein K452DRAFT_283919 [Aplosporella prunicola CBS 121167]
MATTATTTTDTPYKFPPHYSFPPFFTLQPVAATRLSQLSSWSAHIQAYCRAHRLFQLSLIDALDTPLFANQRLGKRLALRDARAVLDWMCSEDGGRRAEWLDAKDGKKSAGEGGRCWVFWRRPEEWAAVLEGWVEGTGQRGVVLTLYEIVESDGTADQGMCLCVCVRVFGCLLRCGGKYG